MRIIKYKNEKQIKCDNCGSIFAYDTEQDADNIKICHEDSVGSVGGFLKSLTNDEKKQLSKEQLMIMKSHEDWVLYLQYSYCSIVCPVCGEKVETDEKFDYIEIYPEQDGLEYGSEPDNVINWFL